MADEEGKKSIFNAGIAQTERIHALQMAINAARYNQLGRNMETMTFNYETIIQSLNGLLSECWAKLTDDEKIEAERVRKLVGMYAERFSPITFTNDSTGNGTEKINSKNYKTFIELLFVYERIIKQFLDVHNLNAPSRSDDEGL
jgi:hypothetical protein